MRWLLALLVIAVTSCGGRSTPARAVDPAPLVDAGAPPERAATSAAPDAGVPVRVVDDFDGPSDPRHRVDCDDCAPGYGCCYGGMCCAKSCKKLDAHGNCPALP